MSRISSGESASFNRLPSCGGYNPKFTFKLNVPQECVPPHQAGPQANPQQLQDHAESGDLAKTEVTCRKTVPNEVPYLQ